MVYKIPRGGGGGGGKPKPTSGLYVKSISFAYARLLMKSYKWGKAFGKLVHIHKLEHIGHFIMGVNFSNGTT